MKEISTTASSVTWLGIDLAKRRWIFPIIAVITTTLIGGIYAFSVFVLPLEAEFGWERAQITAAFSTAMFFLGISTFIGGLLTDRFGPMTPFIVGGCLMVLSQILAAQTSSVAMLIVSYGVILGSGLGLVYGSVTTPLMARWYPDKECRGLAIGVSVMGLGIGSLLAAPLWTWSIEAVGWRTTFMLTGGVFLIVLVVLATLIRVPTSGMIFEKSTGWRARTAVDPLPQSNTESPDFTLGEAIRSRYFALMVLLFFLTIFGGLMVVSKLAAYARELPPGGPGLAATTAATLVMLLAICNGLGRPCWGWISARIGIRNAIVMCSLSMGSGMLLLALGSTLPIFAIGTLVTGFAFGGTLALIPIMTTALFGAAYVGRIYGLIFAFGFGLGGFFGPLKGGALRDFTGTYAPSLYIALVLCLISATLAGTLLPSSGNESLQRPHQRNAET
ncbi:MAG: OFA family MFS transporter [Candidatus Sumerlaeia bacterium]|nr:OFA family MFS transporter [Candidatus Sumerlaeia bacterium]